MSKSSYSYTVACALRADLLRASPFEDYARLWYDQHPEHYHASDLLLASYVTSLGRKIAIHTPSLVQHRDVDSSFEGRQKRAHNSKRQSPTFIKERFPKAPEGHEIPIDGTRRPVLWFEQRKLPYQPEITDEMAERMMEGRKVRSWGHTKKPPHGVHWLGMRGGVKMHTDPNFGRYSHHLILRNDGYRTGGLDDIEMPIIKPGSLYVLDTHSHHQVVLDERLIQGGTESELFKFDLVVDLDRCLTPDETFRLLTSRLRYPMKE